MLGVMTKNNGTLALNRGCSHIILTATALAVLHFRFQLPQIVFVNYITSNQHTSEKNSILYFLISWCYMHILCLPVWKSLHTANTHKNLYYSTYLTSPDTFQHSSAIVLTINTGRFNTSLSVKIASAARNLQTINETFTYKTMDA